MAAPRPSLPGELGRLIDEFVTHKQALGYRYRVESEQLARLARVAQDDPIRDRVIPQTVVDRWVARVPGERWGTQRIRVSCLRVFLQWARSRGYITPLLPPLKRQSAPYVPYIFSEKEITGFFHACDTMEVYPGTDKHLLLPMLFRLLYGTGLRVSEACQLRFADVDWVRGTLLIRESKGGKDRLVAVSPSLRDGLQRWRAHLLTRQPAPTWFFETRNGQPPSRHWIYRQFRQSLWRAGIPHAGRGTGPRVHDLRHTFCVRALKHLVDEGLDVYAALPILSAYVGHASPTATEGYVRLTADLYPEVITAVVQVTGTTIPEVNDGPTH
ncbi:phage integrase [Sulfobacillus acidophilus TPY]|uniref:Integrase family protein n=1 Tax=Sulfobacillus acidophilus (strain ATCC 700253 / DSM 10332 / NAL) TaxID=679936 RepID=G8TYS6_SULAD|nr:phage integrase [Sulfobacillus acidophilus TPY]AEW04015.1 integrase family protein [Sulfobacillus acidophilus DSM 10332]AEW04041.1 integrase family protein [Sulfobacillus acidophilus DSM 10332]